MEIIDTRDTETQPWTREEDTVLVYLLGLGYLPIEAAKILRRDYGALLSHYWHMAL